MEKCHPTITPIASDIKKCYWILKFTKMKSIISLIFIIAFFLQPTLVFGQKHYQSGYIITTNNDTIPGQVKDRKPQPFGKLYKKIRFKDKKFVRRKYGVHQIAGYKQGGNQFESLWIDVSQNLFKQNYTSAPNSGKKYFLKVVYRGYLTYYHWEFQDHESGYIDKIDLFKREGESSFVRVTQGILGLKKKRLAEYFQDCPELVFKIENGEIKYPVEIANFYNRNKK